MKTSLFNKPLKHKVFSKFINVVHSNQMCYCASELLTKGLTWEEIQVAVNRAIISCDKAGLQMHLHFRPRYVSQDSVEFDDCKLSKLGYQLTLMNANPRNKLVARFQLQLLGQ